MTLTLWISSVRVNSYETNIKRICKYSRTIMITWKTHLIPTTHLSVVALRMNKWVICWEPCRVFSESCSPETLADMEVRRPRLVEVNYGNKVSGGVWDWTESAAIVVLSAGRFIKQKKKCCDVNALSWTIWQSEINWTLGNQDNFTLCISPSLKWVNKLYPYSSYPKGNPLENSS